MYSCVFLLVLDDSWDLIRNSTMVSRALNKHEKVRVKIGDNQLKHDLVKLDVKVCLYVDELKLCMINFMKLDWIQFSPNFGHDKLGKIN